MNNGLDQCKKCKDQLVCHAEGRKVRVDVYGRCLDCNSIIPQIPTCNICKKPVNLGEQLDLVTNECVGFDFSCECGISIKVPSTDRANAIAMYSQISGQIKIKSMLEVLKKTYRKHWLDDALIGYHELGEDLFNMLCRELGEEGFQRFIEENKK